MTIALLLWLLASSVVLNVWLCLVIAGRDEDAA